MQKIEIQKNETAIDGFKKLIDAKTSGVDAKWEFGGYVTTTDMIPDNYLNMTLEENINHMKRAAITKKIDIVEELSGKDYYLADDIPAKEYYEYFSKFDSSKTSSTKNKI